MIALRMYAAQIWGDSGKVSPACYYFASVYPNSKIMYGTAIGKIMENRDFNASKLLVASESNRSFSSKVHVFHTPVEYNKENKHQLNAPESKPANVFLLTTPKTDSLQQEDKPKAYRPAA